MIRKEVLSVRQGIALVALFTAGNSLILLPGRIARQDVWISNLLGLVAALMIAYIYSRILSSFPGDDLFDILKVVFGNIPGKIISVFFIWHSMILGGVVFRTFWEFIRQVGLPNTPPAVVIFFMIFLCIWGCKEGLEVMGRWAEFFFLILFGIIIFSMLLATSQVNLENLLPILHTNVRLILAGGINSFTFPFAEIVVFLMVFSNFSSEKPYYRVFRYGLLLGGIAIVLASLLNTCILGPETDSSTYFPSYLALARVKIGNFIERYEIAITVIFLLEGFVKIGICLLAASRGLAKLFNFEDYRFIVIPVGIMIANLSYLGYKNEMEMGSWPMEVWPYVAIPYQVIFPLIIFIIIVIRNRNKTSTENS